MRFRKGFCYRTTKSEYYFVVSLYQYRYGKIQQGSQKSRGSNKALVTFLLREAGSTVSAAGVPRTLV
jgi:hypothetical protein